MKTRRVFQGDWSGLKLFFQQYYREQHDYHQSTTGASRHSKGSKLGRKESCFFGGTISKPKAKSSDAVNGKHRKQEHPLNDSFEVARTGQLDRRTSRPSTDRLLRFTAGSPAFSAEEKDDFHHSPPVEKKDIHGSGARDHLRGRTPPLVKAISQQYEVKNP